MLLKSLSHHCISATRNLRTKVLYEKNGHENAKNQLGPMPHEKVRIKVVHAIVKLSYIIKW